MFKRLNITRDDVESRVSAGLAGGVGPLADHFARLGDPDDQLRGSRRTRLRNSMLKVSEHMSHLSDELYALMGSLPAVHIRSEEHTSELQSRGHLVCRLLLEHKKSNHDDYDAQK